MPNWVERLKGETQAKLLGLVRRSPQTVSDLARALDLTDNAVRSHLTTLRRDGLVEDVGAQRDTGGKPARTFALTREGEELFPKAYPLVLGKLIEEISQREGPQRAGELLRTVGAALGAAAAPANAPDRIAVAADVLRQLGGDVDVQRSEHGWRLQGYGCPLSAVTANRPEVCGLAQALIEQVTGLPVSECCDRSGRPRCAFRIEDRPPTR